MAVQVWIGDKPEHPNERRAIVALANGLERLESLYLLLANFNVGGRTIDLVIIKHDAIFIVELKHCDGLLFGGVNGPWYLENANGERKRLNPGRKNPYNQVISYYYSLTNFLNEHRGDFLSEHRASQINFRSCRRVVVIAPNIQEGSEIDLDWKVELKGLDELPVFLVTERSAEINLTEEEMLAIPEMLGCTRWKDINTLIAGALPVWNDANTTAAEPPAEPEPSPPPEPAAPPTLWQRARDAIRTRPGRVAWGAGALVVLLLVLLVWQPANRVPPPPSQDNALVVPSGPPAGGVFPGVVEPTAPICAWSGFQTVGKHWDARTQRWISVGVSGNADELAPDVVVTLERVDYCGDDIRLSWSVHNNSDDTVLFPLDDENITILDPIGNEYAIDNEHSEPAVIRVPSDSRRRGVAVVSRPVSQNAPSLLVRLKHEPFGEASWLVSLEGH